LSGKLPFEAEKATEVLAKQITQAAASVCTVAPVPRKLAAAIDRCLAKDPGERFQKSEELAEQFALALEQRRELPVGLRVFVKRNARLGGVGGLVYLISLPFIISIMASLFPQSAAAVAWWTFVAGVTAVPFAILVGRAARFLTSGFGPAELGVAFRTELEQTREERLFEYGRGPSAYERIMRLLGVGGLGLAAVSAIILATTPERVIYEVYGVLLWEIFGWSLGSGLLTGFLALLRLNRRVDLDTRIWSWVWQGPIGRTMFTIARWFVPRKSLPPPATHRPTELSLGMAAEQLFQSLPKETRQQLRDLPDVVHRLERDAQRMRARLDELQDALGDAGARPAPASGVDRSPLESRRDRIAADLRRERDQVQQRLADAVAALETIRLNLLKLHAGTSDVRSVTTDLGLAREVAREVDLLLAARKEVDAAL